MSAIHTAWTGWVWFDGRLKKIHSIPTTPLMSSVTINGTELGSDRKMSALFKVLGVVALFSALTFMYSAEEYSGIDAETDTGLKRLENRVYHVLTTLSSVGYGDIYPVSSRARITGGAMMMMMLFSIV